MDDITAMFADITPEDFFRDTSAVNTTNLDRDALGHEQWTRWVDDLLDLTERRCAEDTTDAFAVLRSVRQQRIFTPDDDETPDHWAGRLRREAFGMGATWFFLAMLAPGRTVDEDATIVSIELTEVAIDAALDAGVLDIGVCWIADRRDAAGLDDRAGIITLDEHAHPHHRTEGVLDEENVFANIIPWHSPRSEEDDHAV